jgi:homogentisate 1,2-dioxygenase
MAFYQSRGRIPRKKHTTFYKEDNTSIYLEELTSSLGFDGVYSTKYHIYAPTRVEAAEEVKGPVIPRWQEAPLLCYHFQTDEIENPGNFFSARSVLMFNDHVVISTASPTENTDMFFRNGLAYEMIFVHRGKGTCRSEYGVLDLRDGDHLVIPKGAIYQLQFDRPEEVKLFILESVTPFEIPQKYRNDYGQLLEHAPYSERDFIAPRFVDPVDKSGEFPLMIKAGERLFKYTLDHHPFDVVGWDGFLYPYTFNIEEFCPIVGKIHQPPPVHLVFSTSHFVVCNFTPRLYDFHPQSIPAPYFHANIDSDEILYYVSGDFMSRKGVKDGSITLHPMGHLHGPQPGKYEGSIGKKGTDEYAVMVDTFAPLKLTTHARDSRVEDYFRSWVKE